MKPVVKVVLYAVLAMMFAPFLGGLLGVALPMLLTHDRRVGPERAVPLLLCICACVFILAGIGAFLAFRRRRRAALRAFAITADDPAGRDALLRSLSELRASQPTLEKGERP